MRSGVARALVAALLWVHAAPASAYLEFGVVINGRNVKIKWNRTPVRYYVNRGDGPGIAAAAFQAVVGRAFNTWQAVPTSSVGYQFAGFTDARPGDDDGLSTLGFADRPELNRVLATTSFLIDDGTGEIIEADIFFNTAFPWSTSDTGETGKFDLESIALHEAGHFAGLGHSALGETELLGGGGRRVIAAEAVMFPIAYSSGTVIGRTLRADDIAGISDLYPENTFTQSTGSVSGRVTKNGQGIYGAHVVAFNPATGRMVGNFSLTPQGDFVIAGLSPGPHVIRVEPVDDADTDSFFSASTTVDLSFRVTFFDRLVVVPRGGDSGAIAVKVTPK